MRTVVLLALCIPSHGLEPADADSAYYAPTIPRVTAISKDFFARHVAQGRPLVITDAARGLPLEAWTCTNFSSNFGDAKMRREYDWDANPDDQNVQRLGDRQWETRQEKGLGEDGQANSPKFAPFYWGIRDHYHNKDIGGATVLKEILAKMKVPYFAEDVNDQLSTMHQNSEFWFSAPKAGAKAHMDSHCISTLSINLAGRRQYRLAPIPRNNGQGRSVQPLFDDGYVYKVGWSPMYEFNVTAGEGILFPPGWIHETKNTGTGCAASLTHPFNIPVPASYWRKFLHRVTRTGDLAECWRGIAKLAGGGRAPPQGDVGGSARTEATQRAKQMDTNGDGVLALAEVQSHMGTKETRLARDVLFYHDQDADGTVKVDEFVQSFMEYLDNQASLKNEPLLGPGGQPQGADGDDGEDGQDEEDNQDGRDSKDEM